MGMSYILKIAYNIKISSIFKVLCSSFFILLSSISILFPILFSMLFCQKISISSSLLLEIVIEVFTDSKWTVFIINQIIQNSIKYSKSDERKIKISSNTLQESVVLYIEDNGIGISKKDISKVFDKGFTGENGRIIGKKSTGIGLYLCKKLCDKLRLGIQISSKKDKGTEVRIIFPKGSYINM